MTGISSVKSQLRDLGFARAGYPSEFKKAAQNIALNWRSFYVQNPKHKNLIIFDETGGYEEKNKVIDPQLLDYKEDFHVTLKYDFKTGSFNPSSADLLFLETSRNFLEYFEPQIRLIAKHLTELTYKNFSKYALNSDGWTLRFLHYYPQKGKNLAHYHLDKGGHTIHLYESCPGLECFWKGQWRPVSFSKDEMVFFPGIIGQHLSHGELKALSHRVVSSKESKAVGRVSIVLFNDYVDYPYVFNKELFGPTQKAFQPGQNYDMDHRDFSKFMTERKILMDAR